MAKMRLQAKSKLAALNKELEEAKHVASDVLERVSLIYRVNYTQQSSWGLHHS